ncbi:hypothetical protein V8C37DRAFT_407076 [Trichoderma ceciliae]
MDFDDPLAGYLLTRHPSSDTQVSSAPDSPEQWKNQRERVDEILNDYTPVQRQDDTSHVFRSFLKHLCKEGQMTLMDEIIQFAPEPPKLRMLRNFLVDAILKPMIIAGGKSPRPLSPTPVRNAFQAIQLSMTEIQSSSRKDQAALRNGCLSRDDHRCVITGTVDIDYYKEIPSHHRRNLESGKTECAHILPFALRKFNENSARETEVKATIWWAIYRYFPFIKGKIGAESINKSENAMTLWTGVHGEFGDYRLTFEPTNRAYQYRTHILEASTLVCRFVPAIITMKQSDPSVPLPEPDFLKVHFQVSKILQISGIRKKIEDALRENECNPICNIQADGSTDLAYILSSKMLIGI